MKFDPGKAWPHPVLRPPSYGDDYPHAEFEVDIEVMRTKKSTAIEVDARFELSEPSLSKLLKQDKAQFALLVRSSQTHCRQLLQSSLPHITHSFPAGSLSGRVEFAPFLVCMDALQNFQAEGWHSDFAGRKFDIAPGAVLAEDIPKDYWIDTADEAPLGSIFAHKSHPDIKDGRWDCVLEDDHVWIVMSDADSQQYQSAREQVGNQSEGQYLLNGLYLPALIVVLNEVDKNLEEYQDYRWFSSLDQRLEDVGCSPLGKKGSNRLIDAQKVLDSPFLRMPLIARADMDDS